MRRPALPVALGVALIVSAIGFLVYKGISTNLVYYITPSELLRGSEQQGTSLRLGGQVRPGSVHFNPKTDQLSFVLQDPKAHVRVSSHGLPPQLFRGGAGVVVDGTFQHGFFTATDLMIKHSNSYRAPKPGQTPLPDNFVNSSPR